MNVLLIGSGGREHAIAWKLAQSRGLDRLFILPGNPGTGQLGENLPGDASNTAEVSRIARQKRLGLVVVGPEAPLAAGLADALHEAGIPVFGPSKTAAQIEASKVFAKDFMRRRGIPTARYESFADASAAIDFIRSWPFGKPANLAPNYVVKASGLAGGKGVFLPETLDEAEGVLQNLMVEKVLGMAGRQVVIEERLQGPEVSILAFTDGRTVLPMPPAQDHKRLLEGDRGPNTGGMGAIAPTPLCPPDLLNRVVETILQPTVDGMRSEGRLFSGVLYAGLILTPDGPKVLEFNCRFGDPETQAIMLLLESDLLEILVACAEGRLAQVAGKVKWRPGAAAVVVLASQGYGYSSAQGKGVFIEGLDDLPEDVLAFHAGASIKNGRIVTAGGRVLGIAAYGRDLYQALERAYAGSATIDFSGMYYRRDIGRTLASPNSGNEQDNFGSPAGAYSKAGVSIDAGNRSVAMMREAVRSTYGPEVLSDLGSFGGLYSAAMIKGMADPVLVASTDGVGTKILLAAKRGSYRTIGCDLVNHCVNDILVQGARPLFFMDYFAAQRLVPEIAAEVVAGISEACREAGCALLGGETAELPGIYQEVAFDVAGTILGAVERASLLPRPGIQPGDVLLGLASSGPHTNGYSLIRRIFENVSLDHVYPELGIPLAESLLAPHRSYLHLLSRLLFGSAALPDVKERTSASQMGATAISPIKALAHITGGGFYDNLPRVLPQGCGVRLWKASWPVPPIFTLIQQLGGVAEEEMYRVFNMGIGMAIVLDPREAPRVQAAVDEPTWVIGEVIAEGGVVFGERNH